MDGDFEIIGKVVVDSSGAVSIQGLNDSLGETETRTSALGSISDIVWSGIILQGINLVWDGIKNVIGSVIEFGKSSVDSAMESEGVIARLNAVLEATHYAAGLSSEQLQAMAESLQGVTRYSDETILTGASLLLTFRNIGEEAMQRVLPDMLDMAEIFGSVDSAAMQLGKALNDPIAGMGALGRAGVTFSDDQKEVIKAFMATGDIASAQNVILTELENQVQGVAEAYGQTLGGQIEIAKNKLDNFKELVGGPIMYVMGNMIGIFTDFTNSEFFDAITMFLQDLNRYLGAGVEPLSAIGYALNNIAHLEDFSDSLFGWIVSGNTQTQVHELAMAFLQVNELLQNTASLFPGDPVGMFANALYGLGPILDNLLGTGDQFNNMLSNMGDFIVGLFNTLQTGDPMQLFYYLGSLINNIDWAALSQQFADGVRNIDWVRVGEVIRTGIGIAMGALALFSEVLITMIDRTDWGAVASALASAIAGVVAGLFGYVNWDALMVDFKNGFVYIGQQALNGLASVWGYTAWANFANDLRNGFNYIVNAVKDFLGISSPSTVFASIGKSIVDGLIAGWNATVGSFLTAIGTTIEDIGNLFGIDLSGLLGGSDASGLGTAGGGTGTSGGTSGGGSGGGTVINQYFYADVNVGAMSDLISFDCTVNPVVTSTYPTVGGGLGSGPVGGVAI